MISLDVLKKLRSAIARQRTQTRQPDLHIRAPASHEGMTFMLGVPVKISCTMPPGQVELRQNLPDGTSKLLCKITFVPATIVQPRGDSRQP